MQQAGTAVHKVEDMEFGRRLAVERELEMPGPDGQIPGMWSNVIWDESGAFVIYPTLLGIKGLSLSGSSAQCLTFLSSGEHGDESCRQIVGKGRSCPMDEPYPVPRSTC
jgi:hypothetical protein